MLSPPTGPKEGEQDSGRALDRRPCAQVDLAPAQYAAAQVIGYIKGQSAIPVARTVGGRQRDFTGEHFGARGYFVSTVGRDEKAIRESMQRRGQEDRMKYHFVLDMCIW